MPALSVVIITRNEERNIGRCVSSVAELADEVLVVDSFSTDRTEDICRELGVRFITHPFEDYVSQHRFADSQATHEHILSLDADEALSPELRNSLMEIREGWEHDCYTMNRRTCYCGRWIRYSGWYPDRKLRLYDRRRGEWTGRKVHEAFVPVAGASIAHLHGDILHYSYYTIDDHVAQANRLTNLTAEAAFESGGRAPMWKVLCAPVFRFLQIYLLRLGFLDGYYGFVISRISATATFLKHAKLREMIRQSGKTATPNG
ncbi:MAG: glycosyltransferase family 2 protein [Bacteroidales bacterium]|nr:glycosyltransferase family 2 protein [Bacteroidales bacterium]